MSSEQENPNEYPQDSTSETSEAATEERGEPGELDAARAQADDFRDQLLRARAEMDNIRKRSDRELERAHKYGVERLAGELLPVVDSLEIGLEAAGSDNMEAVAEGIRATLKLLTSVLEKFGISCLDPLGEPFNPEWHEAMATQPSPDAEPDSVLLVVQKGYRIHDRVLRPARVIVSRAVD
ncbi:MAG: nucleotide exchange factor GrpE [Gammaproteobacteria bacterium]|jgi:molecular chaperone GrpE|nr:nucleotide exchange factor GrpE [Gammaproteobacteria bacterium]